MRITIKITKEVLKETMFCGGIYGNNNTTNCAVAFAVREVFPNARVGAETLNFGVGVPEFAYLPQRASVFIDRFDSLVGTPSERLLLPEFSFDIHVPDSVIDKIGINEAKEIISKSSTLELVP
jgi:hypothetical protein